MDILAPGIVEIVGGSKRKGIHNTLIVHMEYMHIPMDERGMKLYTR